MTAEDNIEHTSRHVHIALSHSRRVLSSAPYNGGWVDADHLLILNVRDNFKGDQGAFEPLHQTFENYCHRGRWTGKTVGMMTSARMSSFRNEIRSARGVEINLLVTAGTSNARRAGDPAECRTFDTVEMTPGTINLIILTTATLLPAAMVETVMVVTEAKTAAFQDLGILSPVSGKVATGTGTDAVAVVSGNTSPKIEFCGKHTLFGEMLASATIDAVCSSLGDRKN
jgi:adenosylcobinamide amidohydrolase